MSRHSHPVFRHWFAVMLVCVACLAVSAPAAQARPIGLAPSGGGWTAQSPTAPSGSQVRVVTTKADAGFNWTDTAIGAIAAVAILGLGRVALTRPRPRLTA